MLTIIGRAPSSVPPAAAGPLQHRVADLDLRLDSRGRVTDFVRNRTAKHQPIQVLRNFGVGWAWEVNMPLGQVLSYPPGTFLATRTQLYGMAAGTVAFVAQGGSGSPANTMAAIGDNTAGGAYCLHLRFDGTNGLQWEIIDAVAGSVSGTVSQAAATPYDIMHLTTLDWGPLGVRVFYNGRQVDSDGTVVTTPGDPDPGQDLSVNRLNATDTTTALAWLGVWPEQMGPAVAEAVLHGRAGRFR